MTLHAEYALRSSGVAKVVNLAFAVPAFETASAEGLVPGQYGKILDLIAACAAAVGTVVADERAVTEK